MNNQLTKKQAAKYFDQLCAAMLNLYRKNPNSKIAIQFVDACQNGKIELAVEILMKTWDQIATHELRDQILQHHFDQICK